jgi:hypothetical protein
LRETFSYSETPDIKGGKEFDELSLSVQSGCQHLCINAGMFMKEATKRAIRNSRNIRSGAFLGSAEETGWYVPRPLRIGRTTFEERTNVRNAVFDELYKHSIPGVLIDAVRRFSSTAKVSLATGDDNPASCANSENKELAGNHSGKALVTVDEALACYLRKHLSKIRSRSAHVRQRKMLPKSVIATVAMDMVTIRATFAQPLGLQLLSLLKELLEVDRPKLDSAREFLARHYASWILAQDDTMGTRLLANLLGVNASSVSRWRKDCEFNKEVDKHRKFVELATKQGKWPPPNADHVAEAQVNHLAIAKSSQTQDIESLFASLASLVRLMGEFGVFENKEESASKAGK